MKSLLQIITSAFQAPSLRFALVFMLAFVSVIGAPQIAAAGVGFVAAPSLSLLDIGLFVGVGLVVNRQSVTDMFRGFQTLFNDAFSGTPIVWDKVAMKLNSTTKEEKIAWLKQLPGIREWLGERVINSLATNDQTIVNKDYEHTSGISRNDIEDDRFGVYGPIFAELGRMAKSFPNELIFTLLKNGFTQNCFDGQYFFDTDHPVGDGNGGIDSVSNHGGGASTPWYLLDTSRMVKPLILQERKAFKMTYLVDDKDENVFKRNEFVYGVDGRYAAAYGFWQLAYGSKQTLNATNYAAARSAMMAFKGDGGRVLGVMPKLLVVPPSLEGSGRALLYAEKDAAGADNIWKGSAELLVVPELA